MADYIDVTWEVEDGYAGKSRPQKTRVYLDDIQDSETAEDMIHALRYLIQEDFNEKIDWYTIKSLEEIAQEILRMRGAAND